MLVPLMDAIAARLRDLPGLPGASYPADNQLPASPWIMVRQADEPTRYEKQRFGAQLVTAYIDVVILVASSRETPRDQARLDGLPEIVLDAFDMSLTGGTAAELVPALVETPGDDLRRLWTEAAVERGTIQWGPQFCYAAIVRLDAQFERRPVPR